MEERGAGRETKKQRRQMVALELAKMYGLVREKVSSALEADMAAPDDGYVSEPFVSHADVRRFLARLGAVRRGAGTAQVGRTLDEVASATSTPRPVVERVLGLFCSGDESPGRAICGKDPKCNCCPLQEHCKFGGRKPSIKQLPEEERPRERLIRAGEDVVSNAELLGILIGGGTIEETAVDLGRRLLQKYGTLRELSTKTIGEMRNVRGIGPARAAQLKAAFEVAKRLMAEGALDHGRQFCSSRAIFDSCYAEMRDVKKEIFKTMLFDSKNRLIKTVQVSEGSLTSSLVHPREVYNPAIRESASAVVFVHNHPSGDPTPSDEDIRLTARLKEVGEMVGIRVLDHIVIGEGRYYSFLDEDTL
jgi:DNA repair protein RadC